MTANGRTDGAPVEDGTARTVVLGFDALDFAYLDRFADGLPNFGALRADGVEAPLRSTHPPWTASAWPSMYTGVPPDHHGVYGFFEYDYPDEGRLVTRNDVDAPALWNYCTVAGVPAAVLNVPVTHPAEPIAGALVPGYLAPEDAPGHPEGVRDRLSAALEEPYRIYSRGEVSDDPDEKLAGYLELIRQRGRAAAELLRTTDWELAVLQVQKTDAVFHNFDDEAAFRAVYEAADEFVGTVLEAVEGPCNVVVCSDHGMGPARGYRIYLNEVLRRRGYLTAVRGSRPALSSEKAALVAGRDGSGDGVEDATGGGTGRAGAADPSGPDPDPATRALSRGLDLLSAVGITPGTVYAAAARVGLASTLVDLAPAALREAAGSTVEWRASRAYCRGGSRLGVRINLAGRDPAGVVPPEEYDAVRGDLIEDLSALETPDGRPAFESVRLREAVYDGPHAGDAPDVVVVPREMDNLLSGRIYGREFLPIDKHDHRFEGVFLAAGPDVRPGWTAGERSLTDVAPVAMALSGLPVPRRMTGSVPAGLLSVPVERGRYPDVEFGTGTGAGGDDAVTERLRDLGYL